MINVPARLANGSVNQYKRTYSLTQPIMTICCTHTHVQCTQRPVRIKAQTDVMKTINSLANAPQVNEKVIILVAGSIAYIALHSSFISTTNPIVMLNVVDGVNVNPSQHVVAF